MNKELLYRAISCVAIGFIFIVAIRGSFFIFLSLMLLLLIMMLREWFFITGKNIKDLVTGIVIISVSILSLLLVKIFSSYGDILIWYFIIIWTFDIMAMFGGKFIGGRKIAETISPKKTWGGLITGLYFASITSAIFFNVFGKFELKFYRLIESSNIFACFLIVVFAHGGDFFESYYKRKYGVKDSGVVIPGHGGVLDRFDSIIFSAPLLLLILSLKI